MPHRGGKRVDIVTEDERIADRIFKQCVLDQCDGLWFDRVKAAAIIRKEIESALAAMTSRCEAAEATLRRIEGEDTADAKVLVAAYNKLTAAEQAQRDAVGECERLRKTVRDGKLELIEAILDEANVAHQKCGNVATNDENFQLGRHGGLMWAYSAVCHCGLLAPRDAAKEVGDGE